MKGFPNNQHVIPRISSSINVDSSSYVTVNTDDFKVIKGNKTYGHSEYYYCLIGIVIKKNGDMEFQHWNPRRFSDGNFINGIFFHSAKNLFVNSAKNAKRIIFFMHPASRYELDEISYCIDNNIEYQFIELPVGRKSCALSYNRASDVLLVENLETRITYAYNNLLRYPSADKLSLTQYYLDQINHGESSESAYQKANKYFQATKRRGLFCLQFNNRDSSVMSNLNKLKEKFDREYENKLSQLKELEVLALPKLPWFCSNDN